MEALDHARELNGLLALPRLERMLRVYRTWVNVEGVEGGMALTRRELQCVLEFPELDHHVDFLFDTFRCVSSNRKQKNTPCVDLVTLLTTAAMLAQGPLADKVRFVFQLVDLDIEDDIVEAELALVISTCCDGLYRLGLLEDGDNLSEMDALSVAYEAFDFVELEDGDKMTFAMFLKWCVFHPRSKALLGRISCLFSMCDAVRIMKEALEERVERLKNAETFLYFNDMHFGSLDEYAERIRVVVGPIVGKVEATRVNVLLEVDSPAMVKCFAFALPQEDIKMEMDSSVPTQECKLQSFQPALFTISGLSPGTAYVLRFLGIRKPDRDRCVAVVMTKGRTLGVESLPVPCRWRIRLLNHLSPSNSQQRPLRSSKAQVYQMIARDSFQSPTLTLHYGISLSPQKVSAMLEILERGVKSCCGGEVYEYVLDMIKQEYRRVLGDPCVWELFRCHSNWSFDSNESVLFSGFPEWRRKRQPEFAIFGRNLMELALPVWQSYIGNLWGHSQNNANCLELDDGVILAPVMGHFDLLSERGEVDYTRQISTILKAFSSASAVLLLTRDPVFVQMKAADSGIPRPTSVTSVANARQWRTIQELIEWNLSDLKRQVVMLSFNDVGSYQTQVSITNTTLSLTQLVCGPVVGTHTSTSVLLRAEGNTRSQSTPENPLDIRHGPIDSQPQYAHISSLGSLSEESTGGRQGSGVADAPYALFQAQLLPLQGQHEINRILGPVVGCISSRIARVLLECDAEGEVACVAVDRLTLQRHHVVERVKPYRPTTFSLTKLTPGRIYDLSFQGLQNDAAGIFQTPHEHLPAFRLLIVAEDRFLNGTTDCFTSFGVNPAASYIGNMVDHFFPVIGSLQANVTVHIGSYVALAHELQRKYSLLAQDQQKVGESKLYDFVRSCVRRHWNTPKSQHLLARGAHWFPSVGVLRALLIRDDIPVSFLRTVQRVLAEYEQVGDFRSHSALPSDKYLYRLQSGVAVLMIDTLEAILDSEQLTPFVQLPETLLSTSQWAALECWFRVDHSQGTPLNQTESVNTVVLMCDIPVVSQRGERGELMEMWHQNSRENDDVGDLCSYLAGLGATSWGTYPKEQVRLIHLIFRKLRQNPKFHVVIVCCGAYSSRTTITDNSTKLSFQQIVVGPISMSNSTEQAVSTGITFADEELSTCYSIQQEIPAGALKSQQYCVLELVPHPLGASSDVKFYTQNHGEAKLILGPIIGRVTPRTARILVELDRSVSSLSCILVDSATMQSFSAQTKVEPFTPTIVKVEGLHPGIRYAIKFEGLMENNDTVFGHVSTPTLISLSSEWLVVNRSSMVDFLGPDARKPPQPSSQWSQILANGMISFTAQLAGETSHRNGDTLGDRDDEGQQNCNPWHGIEDEFFSEPLSSPQLLLHLGGQVGMSRAFTNKELASLVVRLARQVESHGHDEDRDDFRHLRAELRYRLQEVYRVAWGMPPMNRILRYTSNLMLLNEDADLYFNQDNLRSILNESGSHSVADATLVKVVEVLRGIAFELWQLYQNQLWVDLAERELKYGSKSSGNKVAFTTTFGINRIVVANVSHEANEYCNRVEMETQKNLSSGAARSLDEPSSIPTVNLFSSQSWKVIDEALDSSSKNPVQQLVLVISGDVMTWGAPKAYPALRTEIVKLFEKLFAWKFVDRVHREVAVICCRKNGSSISFEITDEKLSEKLTLTCIGSISEARELLHRDQKRAKGAVPVMAKSAAISKGYFSKRFSYTSISNTASIASGLNVSVVARGNQQTSAGDTANQLTTRCRTYVSYRFVTDYRRGFFDETLRFFPRVTLPKAVVGPVIGRMVLKKTQKVIPEEPLAEDGPDDPVEMTYTVPILLEINADARVVCVVTDILANQDVRVVAILTRYHPHAFEIPSLVPERRYVYRFEGIANSESRRGSFHTPSGTSSTLNFVAVSSNFPEQMDESTDSLWVAIRKRVQVSWCGLDMILHLGGQVPMHEAAFECFEWVRRGLNTRDYSAGKNDEAALQEVSLRRKVRQRLQQRYRLCWNVPNVRETLAHTSNWFLRSQADIAPFFRNHEVLTSKAAQLVLSEAKKIYADYQLSLMLHESTTDEITSKLLPEASSALPPEQSQHITLEQPETSEQPSGSGNSFSEQMKAEEKHELRNQSQKENNSTVDSGLEAAQFIQTGDVGIFMCDMRSTPRDDVVTCNSRLLTPITQQEGAVIGELQWLQLEKALKKKTIMIFVLCIELPLILTDAKHVDAMREEATFSGSQSAQEEAVGRWKLYDRQDISQHWVSCRRQLEQLLNLLFRWKAKHRGRDAIVLSGGMRAGLETLLQDRETKLSVRNLTVGPVTARVEPDFETLPLDGIACPTFLGGMRDDRFTFSHRIVSHKNYLFVHAVITREQTKGSEERGEVSQELKSVSIETEFIADDGAVDAAHPMTLYRRYPTWWVNYVPMGKIVFWDDTVMMRAQSDEDVTALAQYLQDGREFTAALEVLFEKHQFAEAARMEELRSKHRREQRGPEELRSSLRAVFAELWKVLPETHRKRVAYFQDDFVFDFLLGYLASDLFEGNDKQEEEVERPPLEFAAFSTLGRDFIFNAGMLNLCLVMQQEDERRAFAAQRAEARRQAAEGEAQRTQQEQRRADEEAELARLQQENPQEFAKRKLAEQEAAQQEQLAKAEAARERRKAEKLRDVEEELAIAKEQRKLDKLAESGNDPLEFNRRREVLAARVRKLEDRKRLREAEEARRRKQKEKKKKDKADR
ncbi:hypothetical protein PPTG_24424 [Phytophthora nicotianae INRA-310]|uniref:Uncharacterized protein n=1 Tax=Phytophthora nicotianae (strain INRA-310) TaxID=761204 RepID=W2PGS1_PHYN3|nr:hypothetical protein PPTG_24424 [Phytophthora nicotianae INRA-310]ETM99418.1 hypothetical protein PPTG_24424 [Phytophthora nicotianae INRA-310]